MAQLLFVLLILFAAIGFFRCESPESGGSGTSPTEAPMTRLETTLNQPARVQESARQQVEMINKRNEEILKQY